MTPLQPFPFGGCNLHRPLARLKPADGLGLRYRDAMPSQQWPLTLSAHAMLECLDLLMGSDHLPPRLAELMFEVERFDPAPEAATILGETDLCLFELSTPYELSYAGYTLNLNRLGSFFAAYGEETGFPVRAFDKWRGFVFKGQADRAASALDDMVGLMEVREWRGLDMIDLVQSMRFTFLDVDATVPLIADLRDRVGKPMGMIIHNFSFLPDGRAVSWPKEFKRDSLEVAKRLNLPTLDLADFVAANVAKPVVALDGRHWNGSDGERRIGLELVQFAQRVVGQTPADVPASVPPVNLTVACAEPSIRNYTFDERSGTSFDFDHDRIDMVLVIGDSWALGETRVERAEPVSKELPVRMLAAGPAPRGKLRGGFRSLRETPKGWTRETMCSGMADVLLASFDQRFAKRPDLLFAAAGAPGASLVWDAARPSPSFHRGGAVHVDTVNLVASIRALAAREGKRLRIVAMVFACGRGAPAGPAPSRAYRDALLRLRRDYSTDLCAITGQTDAVPVLVLQSERGKPAIGRQPSTASAQSEAADLDPLVRLCGPAYHAAPEPSADPRRFNPDGYRRLGRQVGAYLMDDVLGSGRQPLRAVDARFAGARRILLEYGRPIAIDPELVDVAALGCGAGIDFADPASPTTAVASVSIDAARPTRLEILLDKSPSGPGCRLFIGCRSTKDGAVGNREGARTAIRSAEPLIDDPLGTPIYDWACIEVVPIR